MRLRSALRKLVRAAQLSLALSSRRIILGLFPAEGEPVRGFFLELYSARSSGWGDGGADREHSHPERLTVPSRLVT